MNFNPLAFVFRKLTLNSISKFKGVINSMDEISVESTSFQIFLAGWLSTCHKRVMVPFVTPCLILRHAGELRQDFKWGSLCWGKCDEHRFSEADCELKDFYILSLTKILEKNEGYLPFCCAIVDNGDT